jgi:hypothetical protein
MFQTLQTKASIKHGPLKASLTAEIGRLSSIFLFNEMKRKAPVFFREKKPNRKARGQVKPWSD